MKPRREQVRLASTFELKNCSESTSHYHRLSDFHHSLAPWIDELKHLAKPESRKRRNKTSLKRPTLSLPFVNLEKTVGKERDILLARLPPSTPLLSTTD